MATRTLPEVKNYVKNVGKSLGFAAMDHLKATAPNTTEFFKNNAGVYKDAMDNIKKLRSKATSTSNDLSSTLRNTIDVGKKNLMADLKSGKFYNKDRIKKANDDMMKDMFGIDFDDFDLDFDLDYEDFNEDSLNQSTRSANDSEAKRYAKASMLSSSILSNAYDQASANIIESNAKVSVHSAAMLSDSIARSTTLLFSQNERIHASIDAGFATIGTEIRKITSMAPALSTHLENSTKYYEESLSVFKETNALVKELTEMQRNLYNQKREQEKEDEYSKVFGSGGFDLRSYAKVLTGRGKNSTPMFLLDMMKSFGMTPGNMSKMATASPLKMIPAAIVKGLFGPAVDKNIKKMDDTFAGFFITAMTNLSKMAEDRNASSTMRDLAKMFGLKIKKTAVPDTSKYNKGPMPYNGVANKAITEVIPHYLARIEAALTGAEARVYNYDTGKWTSAREISTKRRKDEKYNRYMSTRDSFGKVYEEFEKIPDAEKKKAMYKSFDKLLEQVFNDYGTFNTKDKKNKKGETVKAYQYYGFTSEAEFNKVVEFMRLDPTSMWRLAGSVMNGRQRMSRSTSGVGIDPAAIMYNQFYGKDNKMPGAPINMLTAAKDQYQKDVFFYLRGIYSEVQAIRMSGRGKGKGKGSKADPLAAMEARLKKEYDKNNPVVEEEEEYGKAFARSYQFDNDLEDPDRKGFFTRFFEKHGNNPINALVAKAFELPNKALMKGLDFADKHLYSTFFGNGKVYRDKDGNEYNGISDYIVGRLKNTFDDLKKWMKEHFKFISDFLNPIKKELVNKLKFGKDFVKNFVKDLFGLSGNDETERESQGNFDFSSYSDIFDDTAHARGNDTIGDEYDQMISYMARGGVVKRRGLHMLSPGEIIIPASFDKKVQARQEREERKMKKRLFPGLSGVTYSAKGTVTPNYMGALFDFLNVARGKASDITDTVKGKVTDAKDAAQQKINDIDGKQTRKTVRNVIKDILPHKSSIIADGLLGSGVSLLTGMVGGPLLGAAAGAGIGIIRHSKTAQNIVFGKEVTDEEGNVTREGGFIPPKVQEFFKKNFKDMAGFGALGGIAGLFGPFGILPGAAMGAAVGILKNNEKFNTFLFGKQNKDGTWDEGLIKKAVQDRFKESKGRMKTGAIAGVIGGLMLGSPFGILGNAVLGSAIGFATTTETFKNIVFGHEDKDGNRTGGLMGRLNRLIDKTVHFAQKHILEPMKDFAKPMLQMMKNGVQSVADRVSGFLNKMFENTLGMPLKDLVEHKIVGGLLKWMKRLLFLPVTAAKGVIAAPFHMLGFVGNNIRNSQIKKGTATDMTASQRIAWRDKHYIRNLGGLKYDRFNALDEMIAKDFNGSDGVDKMRAMREEINTFLGASRDLGARGAKLMKDIGSDISNYLNTTHYEEDPEFKLYDVISYGKVKKLHKTIKAGDWEGVLKWIDEQVKKGKMTSEQATEFAKIIGAERVDEIKKIIENKEYNQKQSKQGWYQIVSTSKGTLTNKTHLRRLMRNLDTEIAAREKEDAAEAAAREAEANTPLGRFEELYKTNSVKLYNVLKAINDNLVMVNGGEGLSVDADGKVSYKTRTAASTEGKGSGINKNNSPSMSDLADKVDSGELDTQEAVDEGTGHSKNEDEKRRFRSFLSRFVTKKKNRREKDEQDSTTESPSNESSSTGGIITGKLTDLKNKLKNGYHLFTTKEGRMELRDAVGKRIKGPWSNKIDTEERKENREKNERFSFLKTMKKVIFGKLSPIAFLRGAKNGILGLLSAFTQSKIGKVIKGVFVGATIAALLGHASQSLKTGGILAVARDWIVGKIKSIGSFLMEKVFTPVGNFLSKQFPNIFGEGTFLWNVAHKVKDFFDDPVTAIKNAIGAIKDWYIEGLKYFASNIAKPFIYNILPKVGTMLWNAIHIKDKDQFLQTVESVETVDKQYQSTDKEGKKLYKDNITGEATTSAVDANGEANEAIMNDVTVKKTTYGNYGSNVITNIRKAVFNKRDPNGNLVAYEQEATNPITGHKFTMKVSGQGEIAGSITIRDEETGMFLLLSGYNSKTDVYQTAYFGYMSDEKGSAIDTAGTVVGIIAGVAAAIAIPFTGGLSLALLGLAAGFGTAKAVASGFHAIYKMEGGGYQTLCQLNMSDDSFMEILRYFALTGNTGKNIDAWPEFESSEEWENFKGIQTTEEGKAARQKALDDLTKLDVVAVDEETGQPTLNGENMSKLTTNFPRDNTKVNVWWRHQYIPSTKASIEGAVTQYSDYQWLNMPANLISDSDAGFLLKMYRDDGVEGWYDTRCKYDELPKEIKRIVNSKDWHENENPMLTSKWPTTQKANDSTSYSVTSSDSYSSPIYTRNGANVGTYTNRASSSSGFTASSSTSTSSSSGSNVKNEGATATGGQTYNSLYGGKGRRGKGRFDYGYDYDHVYQKSAGLRNESFGDKLFGDYGCGPATATNMINHLSGTGSILGSATNLAKRYIDSTGGTTTDYFSDIFSKSGYNTAQTIDKTKIRKGLKAGVPAVLLGNSGADNSDSPFGANDHYINVYGLDKNNNAIVEDPDLPYSRVKYPLNRVMKDVKHSTFVGAGRLSGRNGEGGDTETNAKMVYSVMHNLGIPNAHIAGMLGNWSKESGIDPTGVEGIYGEPFSYGPKKQAAMANPESYVWNSLKPRTKIRVNWNAYKGSDGKYYPGIGIGGFTGPATTGLIAAANEKGVPWYTMPANLYYTLKDGGYRGGASWFSKWNQNPSATPEAAATYFLNKWEGITPAAYGSVKLGERQQWARKWYDQMGNWPTNITMDNVQSASPVSGTTTDGGNGTAANNSLTSKIAQLGRTIFTHLYGSNLTEMVMPTNNTSGTTDVGGASTGDGSNAAGSFVGTGDPSSSWVWPIHGKYNSYVSSKFGPRNVKGGSNPHMGIDVGGGLAGKEIVAVAPGEVVKVVNGLTSARGRYVQIKHKTSSGKDMYVIYQHNKRNTVNQGDTVRQGQTVGIVGGTGTSENQYGAHLHFEVSPDGQRSHAVDPLGYVSTSRKYTGAGRSLSGRGSKNRMTSNAQLSATKEAMEQQIEQMKHPLKRRPGIVPSKQINNKFVEGLKDIVKGSDGNLYGPPILGAAGRTMSGRAATDNVNWVSFLNSIVQLLVTIANNSALLARIVEILSNSGIKVDATAIKEAATAPVTEAERKAQIRRLVSNGNTNPTTMDVGSISNSESTQYIVQVMEALASR